LLHDVAGLARDLRVFLGDDGILPHGAYRPGTTWSVFDLVSTTSGAAVVMALGAAALVAFTVGFRTRLATFLSWIFVSSIHHRNFFLVDGGDMIARALLFWSLFADLGAAYGIDARRRPGRVVDVPAFGMRLLQMQIAILYSGTARVKMRAGWLKGDAVFDALQLDGFTRPAGAVLGRSPALCKLMTYGTLVAETLFPLAAFSPFAIRACRVAALVMGLALQLGILVTMRVGIFTEVMIASMALFVPVPWIDRAERHLRARGWLQADARPETAPDEPRWLVPAQLAAGVQLGLCLWGPSISRWLPLPGPLAAEVRFVDVEADYGMFATPLDLSRWRGDGVLADGSRVEVVSVVAPGAAPTAPGWTFDRWYKVMAKEHERRFPYPTVGAYFCRRWDELRPGSPLRSFTLYDDVAHPRVPDGPAQPITPVTLWRQTCSP
ncbi:MAG: HTTM domain-containing protein, partial [Polyangiaceae bacterium]